MHSSPATLHQAGLIVLARAGLVGALAWALWPKAVWCRCRASRQGDRSSSPSTRRARPASRTSTRCRRRSRGKLVRLSLEAGDRVKKDVTHRCHHRADGAGLPRCARHARTRGAGRSRQGRRGAGRGGNQPGRVGARVRRKRARTGARPDPNQDDLRARAWSGRASTSTPGARRVARAKANLEVRKRELESAQARLIGPEEAWKGEVPVGMLRDCARARERPGAAAHPGKRTRGCCRNAAGRHRRSRQSRTGGRVALDRRGQGARGGHGDRRGLGRDAADRPR